MNNINQFPFYKNYYELLDNLSTKDKRIMLEIIVDFIFKDEEPKDLKKMNLAIWNNIKMPLANSKKNILNGQKGGRPKQKKDNKNNNPKNNPKDNPKNNPKDNQIYISIFLFLFNNINIYNINNKEYIYKLLDEYLNIRKKAKYVVTETVVKRLIKKLNEYGKNDEEKIEIIERAITGKWKDFYPIITKKETLQEKLQREIKEAEEEERRLLNDKS